MKLSFERGALALVGLMVFGLMGAVFLDPPEGGTSSPRAVMRMAASAMVPPMDRPRAAPLVAVEAAPAASGTLSGTFRRLGYDYDSLFQGESQVPRIFLASVPSDLGQVREVPVRKALFIQTVLPLVLQANEKLLTHRERLADIKTRRDAGEKLDAIDRLWLAMMAERYKVKRGDLDALLARVDIIPPSLALAQAAAESGWGTSRFVREGNALFGQWTSSAKANGLVPLARDAGKTHRIKIFPSLLGSVESYILNLNTHRAYRGLRKLRAKLRAEDAPIDGGLLAGELIAYSERGLDYVATLRDIIGKNRLRQLDNTRLMDLAPVGSTADRLRAIPGENGA